MKNKKSIKKGFTLIELLVVVLIIGILASIALPQYQKAVDKSRYTQAMILMNNLIKGEEVYHLENGTYTQKFEDLDIELPTPNAITNNADSYTYTYSWGYCYTHNTGYGVYYAKVGDGYAGYFKFWNNPAARKPRCWAKPMNNQRANDVCKIITNKQTGSDNTGGNLREYYFD